MWFYAYNILFVYDFPHNPLVRQGLFSNPFMEWVTHSSVKDSPLRMSWVSLIGIVLLDVGANPNIKPSPNLLSKAKVEKMAILQHQTNLLS